MVGADISAVHFVTVLSKVPGVEVARTSHVRPMLIAVGAGLG